MSTHRVGSTLALLGTIVFWSPVTNADDGTGTVTTVSVPGGGKPVVAKTDTDGTIHLLYDSDDGPKYARSSDGGADVWPADFGRW